MESTESMKNVEIFEKKSDSAAQRPEGRFFTGIPMAGMVLLIVVLVGLAVDSIGAAGGGDNFFADVVRMDNVAKMIHQNYVEDVASKDLVDNAIKGMMQVLDPHTAYFEAKEYEDLRMQTEGKFGGLGIQISIRDKVLTVMTPISGTPAFRAGIQSGDQIIRIDGVPTRGITTDKAVTKLRGDPGTEVKLLIRRRGEAQDLEYVIKREIITIKSVPFSGVLDNGIGYVVLSTFSQDAGAEVERAIRELLKKNIKGLIFDLRYNPGGLLPQSIEVSGKFLPKKTLVVSTRGRVRNQNNEHHSNTGAVLPMDMPLVVLVDKASASASEIVAGAVQDWDRGVIMGDTTFGKGSVQSILQLDAVNHLKLTTAFYYTPAGRCINKPENFSRKADDEGGDEEEADEGEAEEVKVELKKEPAKADTATYRTKILNRLVCGGGGIVPDTVVQRKLPEAAVRALLVRDMFFQFANLEYVRLQKRGVKITASYQPDEATVKAFYSHIDSVEFTFQSMAQVEFEEFKKRSGIVEDTTLKDNKNPYLEPPKFSEADFKSLKSATERVDSILAADSKKAIRQNEDEIKRLIKDALLIREFGQDHESVFRSKLAHDEQLKAALGLIGDKNAYARLLKAQSAPKSPTAGQPAKGSDDKKGQDKKKK
ncbi:MAG: S41 family peptidase [Chitinispirillia bacterium]|nr:S41 family peptidase [Chitinispirillia bacterium]MCL2241571.1 S41 family peptidase [Chitinispirillia bacterium]